ncbi:hypothetical protein AB1N83_009213 [Pleurotus pulmonarius]
MITMAGGRIICDWMAVSGSTSVVHMAMVIPRHYETVGAREPFAKVSSDPQPTRSWSLVGVTPSLESPFVKMIISTRESIQCSSMHDVAILPPILRYSRRIAPHHSAVH